MTATWTRSDARLATALRMPVTWPARALRVERTARGLKPGFAGTQLAALERPATMTPGELAGREKVQPSSMTRVIAVLKSCGLAARALHLTGRRQAVLAITHHGGKLLQQSQRLRGARLARRLTELSPQDRATLRAAAPVLDKLSQSWQPTAGRASVLGVRRSSASPAAPSARCTPVTTGCSRPVR